MALLELKNRLARYFAPADENAPVAKNCEPTKQSAPAKEVELTMVLRSATNTQGPASAPASTTTSPTKADTAEADPSSPPGQDSPCPSSSPVQALPSSPDSPTVTRLQERERRKRRTSYGPKAEPLAKKLWRKKERERLRELDEAVRLYTLRIAEKEALYRQASALRNIRECEDLTKELSDLLAQKSQLLRDKTELRMQILRKSQLQAKYRTL